jgi:hypothetical protein
MGLFDELLLEQPPLDATESPTRADMSDTPNQLRTDMAALLGRFSPGLRHAKTRE